MTRSLATGVLLAFITLLTLPNELQSQNVKKLRIKWDKTEPSALVEKYSDQDAYIVKRDIAISNSFELQRTIEPTSFKSERRRIKILTKKGVDEQANVIYRLRTDYTLESVDARTIKSNGKTIEIADEDIDIKRYVDPIDKQSLYEVRFNMPNVEPGDEIEFVVAGISESYATARYEFVNADIPTHKLKMVMRVKRGLETIIYSKNGLSTPIKKEGKTFDTFTWKEDDLKGFENVHHADRYSSTPHLFYYLKSIFVPSHMVRPFFFGQENWAELYDLYRANYSSLGQLGGIKDLVAEVERYPDESNFDKLNAYVVDLMQDISVVPQLPESERNLDFATLVGNKRIDENNLILLYESLLEELEIPFGYVFGRNRYVGPIIGDIITVTQITDVGFSILDSDGQPHFLFAASHDDKLFIDEIPSHLIGTTAILLEKESRNSHASKFIRLPISPKEINLRTLNIAEELSKEADLADVSISMTLSGAYSLDYRDDLADLEERKDTSALMKRLFYTDLTNLKIDSLFIGDVGVKYPYALQVYVHGTREVMSAMDAPIIKYSLGEVFLHDKLYTEENTRFIPYLTPAIYSNRINYQLRYPANFKLQALDDFNLNDGCQEVYMTMEAMNNTPGELIVRSTYVVNSPVIQAENYPKLVEVNTLHDQMRETELLFARPE